MSVVASVGYVKGDVSADEVAAVDDGGSVNDDVYVAANYEFMVDSGCWANSYFAVSVCALGDEGG